VDSKKFRDCLGLFATGVIIACGRRKNFLAENIATAKFFENKIFDKNFFSKTLIGKNLLQKFKKIFAEEFFGMTINSFTSVSLEPPLVMFCVDDKSANLRFFKKNRYFSLNVLSQDQKALATAFARPKNSTKWGVEPYLLSQKGNPIFQNSLGFFECKKHRVIRAGDHHIVIGEVMDFEKMSDENPLLYYSGKYSALQK